MAAKKKEDIENLPEEMPKVQGEPEEVKGEDEKPKKNLYEVVINYLNKAYKFRFNTIMHLIEMRENNRWIKFEDRQLNNIHNHLRLKNFKIGRNSVDTIIKSNYCSELYDPFASYLNRLKAWDGTTDYISQFLESVTLTDEAADRDFFNITFKKWFVAMVACMSTDKIVNQTCYVFQGEQGIFKTGWQKALLPYELQEDYFFNGRFNFDNKDNLKHLGTKVLIQLDELSSFAKSDTEVLKTVMTLDRVIQRNAYDRYDSFLWRKASFIGNTNKEVYLRDETGSRRFINISVESLRPPDVNIDLCYAQALWLFRSGFKYWFDREDSIELENRNMRYHAATIEEDLIIRHLKIPSQNDEFMTVRYMSTTEIYVYLIERTKGKLVLNDAGIRRCGEVLKKLGFKHKSKRITGLKNPIKVYEVIKIESVSDGPDIM